MSKYRCLGNGWRMHERISSWVIFMLSIGGKLSTHLSQMTTTLGTRFDVTEIKHHLRRTQSRSDDRELVRYTDNVSLSPSQVYK